MRSSLQLRHKALPDFVVDDAADAKRRDDAADARRARRQPPCANHAPAVPPRHRPLRASFPSRRAIVQIQTEQMQRRRKQLHRRGRQELRGREARNPHALRCIRIQVRRQPCRYIKRCKDRQAVPQRENRKHRRRHGSRRRRTRRAEELDERLVLVHAERDVGEGGRGELGGTCGGGARGEGRGRGRGGVERVGGEIGAAVEEEDEADGLGGERAEGVPDERGEGGAEGGEDGRAGAGGVFHDGSVREVRERRGGEGGRREGTDLSMKAMRGDISPAAQEALIKSAPTRMPRFFVFHWRGFELVCELVVVGEDADDGVGGDRSGDDAEAAAAEGAMAMCVLAWVYFVSIRFQESCGRCYIEIRGVEEEGREARPRIARFFSLRCGCSRDMLFGASRDDEG